MVRFAAGAVGAVLSLMLADVATAQTPTCAIAGSGARCVSAPGERTPFPYETGSTLPRGKYQVMLNTEYYGLPPSDGSFWYFKVQTRILQVNPGTMQILGDATRLANRAF